MVIARPIHIYYTHLWQLALRFVCVICSIRMEFNKQCICRVRNKIELENTNQISTRGNKSFGGSEVAFYAALWTREQERRKNHLWRRWWRPTTILLARQHLSISLSHFGLFAFTLEECHLHIEHLFFFLEYTWDMFANTQDIKVERATTTN